MGNSRKVPLPGVDVLVGEGVGVLVGVRVGTVVPVGVAVTAQTPQDVICS